MMEQQAKPAYVPTHVTDSNTYDPTKGTIKTKVTHYVLWDGTKSSIELPVEEHTVENVQTALQEAAAHHAAIMGIQGPPMYPGRTASYNPFVTEQPQ